MPASEGGREGRREAGRKRGGLRRKVYEGDILQQFLTALLIQLLMMEIGAVIVAQY